MAETSDFQGTIKIRAKNEEVIAKIIALNSVAQMNAYYDTQFQDFETIRHSKPDQALKDILSKLTFEKTPEGVECKDLKIYGNGRYSIHSNLSWFLENLLEHDAKLSAYKAIQDSIKNEDFDIIVSFYDFNAFDIESDIEIGEVVLHRKNGQNSEETLSEKLIPLTPENLKEFCNQDDALSPRYLAEHLKEFYPTVPADLEKYTIDTLTDCDEPEEIAFDLSDIFDRIERTDLYNDLSKYKVVKSDASELTDYDDFRELPEEPIDEDYEIDEDADTTDTLDDENVED